MKSNKLLRLLNWVQTNEVLAKLLTKNKPAVRAHRRRQSLLEQQGFEKLKHRPHHSFDHRYKVRTSTEPKTAKYPQSSNEDKSIEIIVDNYKRIYNLKGKVIAKDLYECMCKNFLLKGLAERFLFLFRSRFYTEITIEETRLALTGKTEIQFKTHILPALISKQLPAIIANDKHTSVVRALFEEYDLNKDGFISLQELRKALYNKFTQETIDALFHEHDTDHDGLLDFQDFLTLYAPVSASNSKPR